ncbi:MAG TPA: DUF2199 domain-containing protein [Pyrinomonadaceae bacterium]|nr:DUF2199 domain-containing protein [Pyrinomonadaceae bacterium]
MSYRCLVCGELHEGLPDVGLDKPDYWWGVPEEERDSRVVLFGADACIIDDEDFFIRGVIEIPIHDYPESFGFGVWVSQKRENFYTYLDNFNSAEIGPFFGWLSTNINYFEEDTLSLKTMAHFRGGQQRPRIELDSTEDHPLAVAQRDGISLDKAWEIVHFYQDSNQETT